MKKDLLAISDLTTSDIVTLLNLAIKLKFQQESGEAHQILSGKTLAMIFTKSSTRTRVSFETGMYQLGGHALNLSGGELQLGRGETIEDTAKVLSRYVDGIMIRTYSHSDVEELAKYASIPVINGLTDDHHPCQVLADMLTIIEHKGKLDGITVAYVGDGNNVANSLLQAAALAGFNLNVATPPDFAPCPTIVQWVQKTAQSSGAVIKLTNDPVAAVSGADVVYTDTWVSMGQEADKATRVKAFEGFQVDSALFAKAKPDAIFMHDLPAYRGFEVSDEVMAHERSVIYDQAENRLHAQKAVLAALL